MDFQYWLYIIIGIIYLLSSLRKKKEKQPTDFPEYKPEGPAKTFEQPVAKPVSQKALTFEELLREITEGKIAQEPKPVESKQDYVDYDDTIAEEAQDLEVVDYDEKKSRVYESYEEAKRQAFVRPSLEETTKLSDTDMRYGKFKAFEQEHQRDFMKEYLADLKDPDGLKKAIVMSEILNRKF